MKPASVRRAVRFVILLAIVLMAGYVFRNYERNRIPEADQSLSPLYPGGSRVLCELLDGDDPLERGMDVVYAMEAAHPGTGEPARFARFGRIRGLPGDDIGVDAEGLLTVNGERIGPINMRGEPLGRVPPDRLFILAINPQETGTLYVDSRRLGFIPREDVRARILARWGFGG
jgi:hypothetical protein